MARWQIELDILNPKTFKFLGIHIDETVSWKYHVDTVASKITHSNYATCINKAKNILPRQALKILYESLVQSHINYGLPIWGNSNYSKRIFKLQKKSLRIINSKPHNFHTDPLFKENKILKLHDQYRISVMSFMFDMKTYLSLSITTNIFN